jgi:hypothetical protein
MGAAGRERVREQHDAKGYVAAYLRLLDELLAPAPRRTTRAAGAAVALDSAVSTVVQPSDLDPPGNEQPAAPPAT